MAEILSPPQGAGWVRGIFTRIRPQRTTEAIYSVAKEAEDNGPFQRLFVRPAPRERCDRSFVRAYMQFHEYSDGTKAGAWRHFNLLQSMSPGLRFAGISPADPMVLLPRLQEDPELMVAARGPMYRPDGTPFELEHVALAHFSEP